MPRSNTFNLIFVIAMAAIGSSALIWGVATLTYTPRSQSALNLWLKHMKAFGAPQFTSDQFERETLTTLVRYQRRIQGTLMIGIGSGLVVGSAAAIGLASLIANAYLNMMWQWSDFSILFGPIALGSILGLGLSALISVFIHGASSSAYVAPPRHRIRDFRSRWYGWVAWLLFIMCAAVCLLVVTNTLHGRAFTNGILTRQPSIWLLLTAPGLTCVIVLTAEIATRLVILHPLRADGLEPGVAAHAQDTYTYQAVGQLWGVVNGMGVAYMMISEDSFVAVPQLTFILSVIGMVYLCFGYYQLLINISRSWASMARAIALAAKPHADAPDS
ncbi:MAG TPA: hypothetical protein VMV29_08060 [Ktedonobacterales bacterium]|nr:hypothetical protein [Ktedonobacterales bacterium]